MCVWGGAKKKGGGEVVRIWFFEEAEFKGLFLSPVKEPDTTPIFKAFNTERIKKRSFYYAQPRIVLSIIMKGGAFVGC